MASMARRSAHHVTAAALLAAVTSAHLAAASPPFPPLVEEHRLRNGLRVVLAPDDSLPDVSIIVRYEAGHGDDPDGLQGLAHVTEHVLFGAFRQGEHARLLLEAGASNLNAYTSLDFTSYTETVPPESLDLALWLEGARMATAARAIDDEAAVRERTAAGHEIRQFGVYRGATTPLFDFAWDELFPEWHPYNFARDPVGALGHIGAVDIQAFATTWYAPNNASVVVAGRFDAQHALERVQAHFGSIAAHPLPLRPALPALPAPGNVWLDIEARVTHPSALMVWRGPGSRSPEERALTLAAQLLGGPDGVLRRQFVDGDGGALQVDVGVVSGAQGSAFTVAVKPRAGTSLAELLPLVQATMKGFPDRIGEDDLSRVRKRLSDLRRADLETSMGRASRLADPRAGASWGLDDFDAVDRAGVVDSMLRFLGPGQRVTMVIRPATRALPGVSAVLLHRDRMAQ
jgi:zinc protease